MEVTGEDSSLDGVFGLMDIDLNGDVAKLLGSQQFLSRFFSRQHQLR